MRGICLESIAAMVMMAMACATSVLAAATTEEKPTTFPGAVEDLMAADAGKLFEVVNGTVEKVTIDGQPVLRWHINPGQESQLSLRRDHPLFARLRFVDRMQFDMRIASGAINTVTVQALGHVSGPRAHKVHQGDVAVLTTPQKTWLTRQWDFYRPNWLPWDIADGEGTDAYFRFKSLAIEPNTVVELRTLRFIRGLVQVKPYWEMPISWPVKTENADGSVTYTSEYQVLNAAAKPATITARIASEHKRFKATLEPAKADVKNVGTAVFKLSATISKADIDASPELYAEPLRLAFANTEAPQAEDWHIGNLVRPLSKGLRTQVIVPDADLKYIREKLAAGDKSMESLTELAKVTAVADAFLPIKLLRIPTHPHHVSNNFVPGWTVGDFMPEIVESKTGQREAFSHRAMSQWQSYLHLPGQATENTGMAYLLTGDERYAQKAVELIALYGKQYSELPWNNWFSNPPGPPILGASRVVTGSTYGTNWLFKGHMRMLSAVSESKAWADAPRGDIYKGFVLPYATELMKFHGGISNMTDITNHQLILLGLIFDDAGFLHFATQSDPGLANRLKDITPDGFSSEGRPLGYHFAAMAEYLPSINYIENSGLKIDYPKDRLPQAMRMSYQRASLTGNVPTTGDSGRGLGVRNNWHADQLVTIFPNEKWLFDIGYDSTLSKKVWLHRTGGKVDGEAWRKLLETTPRLFPDAGLAVLRTGDTADSQVSATLDYGRNFFHAGLDRMQFTLFAFGRTFTHGPGSLYNVGSGGMTRNKVKQLDSFISHDSLSHNVVIVDATNQSLAIGRLLAWSDKPEKQVAVATVDAIRPGVSHTRGIVLAHGLVFILDRLQSHEEHSFDFVYHNFGTLRVGDGWKAQPLSEPLAKTGNYENIVDPQRLTGPSAGAMVRLDWDLSNQIPTDAPWTGPKSIGLSLWQAPVTGGEVYTGVTGLNNPNTMFIPDAAPSLFHRVRGKSANFLTVLEPHTGTSRIKQVNANGDAITATLTDGKTVTVSLDQLIKDHAVPAKK